VPSRITSRNRTATIVGLIFALGWPAAPAAFIRSPNFANIRQDVATVVVEWASLGILFAIVVFWERMPFLSTVGLTKPQARDWLIVLWFAVLAAAACAFLAARHLVIPVTHSILGEIVSLPLWIRASLVFTAGVCEEVLFRGYAIERLKLLTGNIWSGALVGTVFFALAHAPLYGFSSGLIVVALIGAALAAVYAWRRNLAGCIALHWLIDGFSLLILPAFATLK
jgi:uncharacterized protein